MDAQAHGEHHEDHGGLGKYGVVFLCLCALTACSFMTTQPWWPFAKAPTWIFMMGVSCVKAMLVILFFMHLLWEANWKYVLTVPAAMMSCFLLLMLVPDIGLRGTVYSEERTIFAAETVDEHAEHVEHGEGDHGHGGGGDDHNDADAKANDSDGHGGH